MRLFNLNEIGCEVVNWICVAEDLLNTAMKIRVPQNAGAGDFLIC